MKTTCEFDRPKQATPRLWILTLAAFLALTSWTTGLEAQNEASRSGEPLRTDVPFEITEMRFEAFDPPVLLGVGERSVKYSEALVIVVSVRHQDLDELSPSLAPRLVIGTKAFAIHKQTPPRGKSEPTLLTFHLPKWEDVEEGSPIYLTTDVETAVQGLRRPSRDTPRFRLETLEAARDN